MIHVELMIRKHDDALRATGSGGSAEAATDAVIEDFGERAGEDASELELVRLEVDGLDLTGGTRRAEDAALEAIASFRAFGDQMAMERAIRDFQEARAASSAYQLKVDAILARCEACWGWTRGSAPPGN